MIHFANFGAFDRENFGDLLYPVILRRMLQAKKLDFSFKIYSFLKGNAPGKAGYSVNDIQCLLTTKRTREKRALIIGGGDILRTEIQDYGNTYKEILHKRRSSNLLLSMRDKILGERDLITGFISKHLRFNSTSPFLLDENKYLNLSLICYCSCGVPFHFDEQEKTAVAKVFNSAHFIYLRDEQSKKKLIEAGVSKEIYVAPDIIFTISEFMGKEKEKQRGKKIFEEFNIDPNKKMLCFQGSSDYYDERKLIVEQLVCYKKKHKCEVILLPLGYCHDDHKFLQTLSEMSLYELKFMRLKSIWDMLSIIAASDIFVGSSMHGNIVALSYGIPHLIGPRNEDKMEGFMRVADLDNWQKLNNWSELLEKLENYENKFDKRYYFERSIMARQKVHKVFNLMLNELRNPECNFNKINA